MSMKWSLVPTAIPLRDVSETTNVSALTLQNWLPLLPPKRGARFQLDASDALALICLAESSAARVDLKLVAPALPYVVNAGLLHLALGTMPWPFVGGPLEEDEFRKWLGSQHAMVGHRHVQELLGIQERGTQQFIVLGASEPALRTDIVAAVTDRVVGTFINAHALAQKLKGAARRHFFQAKAEGSSAGGLR